MTQINFKGNPVHTAGTLPSKGQKVPDFKLVKNDLTEATLTTYQGKKKVLNIFPSIDTGVCATSVRTFNKEAVDLPGTVVLNISADLPFAQKRFCGAEGIQNTETLSTFRSSFSNDYGVTLLDSPLAGLCSRAVIVLDENNTVIYSEQVSEITQEPNYTAALKSLKN